MYLYLYFAEAGFERYILHDVDPVPCADLWRDVYIGGRCAPSADSLVHIARVWKRYENDSSFGGIVS